MSIGSLEKNGICAGDRTRRFKRGFKLLPLLLTEVPSGLICTNAGVDCSNLKENMASFLPSDPDEIARQLRQEILKLTGKKVAVLFLLVDTETRILRQGTADIAVGVAGMEPLRYQFGKKGRFGKSKVWGHRCFS